MSPKTKVSREIWIVTALSRLGKGRIPGVEVSLAEMCKLLEVTKGSFYSPSHFPGGIEDLSTEVISRWQPESVMDEMATSMRAIRDPRDRLRLLRARAIETAPQDAAMRRWAERSDTAAAAAARVKAQITGHVTTALGDLGFNAEDAAVTARLLVDAFAGAFHVSPGPEARNDPAVFESVLSILVRAAAAPDPAAHPGMDVATAPGAVAGETIVYPTRRGATPAERQGTRAAARRYAAETAASPPGAGRKSPSAGRPRGTSA